MEFTASELTIVRDLITALVVTSLLLMLAIVAFKAQRDRVERTRAELRDALETAWRSGEISQIERTAQLVNDGGVPAQSDLAAVCARVTSTPWWDANRRLQVQRAARSTGLAALLESQFDSEHEVERGLAVHLAGFQVWPVPAQRLTAFTDDDDGTIRLGALAALARIGEDRAARELIAVLRRRRIAAERIIERIGAPWAVAVVLEEFAASDLATRQDLLRALALAADVRATDVALQAAASPQAEERVQALRVLIAVAPQSSTAQSVRIRAVADASITDEHPNLRSCAIALMQVVGRPQDIDRFEQLTTDANWFVRRAAARALVSLGDEGLARLRLITLGDDAFAAQRAQEELDMQAAATRKAAK